MGRFTYEERDNYGGSGSANYFSLVNDKDTARVRIMYNGMADAGGYAVHQVDIGDKKRYVNCLRSYRDSVEKCPFCAAQIAQKAKLFIPIYNINSKSVQFWERGKKFYQKLSSLCSRYPRLVSEVFEIERNGVRGDMSTTYEIYPIDGDNTTLEDLPDIPDVLGTIVLDKSADEMNYYLDNGEFPSVASGDDDEVPFRETPNRQSQIYERRTPANTGRRGGF